MNEVRRYAVNFINLVKNTVFIKKGTTNDLLTKIAKHQ